MLSHLIKFNYLNLINLLIIAKFLVKKKILSTKIGNIYSIYIKMIMASILSVLIELSTTNKIILTPTSPSLLINSPILLQSQSEVPKKVKNSIKVTWVATPRENAFLNPLKIC
jgi:hypothetical protein